MMLHPDMNMKAGLLRQVRLFSYQSRVSSGGKIAGDRSISRPGNREIPYARLGNNSEAVGFALWDASISLSPSPAAAASAGE
jgi:hypothetical protein